MQKLGPQEISNRTHWTDPEKLPQYLIARLQLTGRGPLVRSHGQFLMDDIPWKSNPHFLQACFRTTSILVRFYHRPKNLSRFEEDINVMEFCTEKADTDSMVGVVSGD